MSARERISVDEAHARFRAQGVSAREHVAFVCVVCGTVQSMASLVLAGAKDLAQAERLVGFSCEGRLRGAGPWRPDHSGPTTRGCDWTLGGLLSIHTLEVDGQPSFQIAPAAEALALERWVTEQQRAA